MIGIYKITSPSGKVYIGQSKDIDKRKNYYKRHACHNQTMLYHSLKCYGFDAHEFDILCECGLDELNLLEVHYIKIFDSFKNGLNLTSGGNRPEYSEDTRRRMVENRKPLTEEHRKAMSDFGKTRIGVLNPMFGKTQREETKIKISEKAKGRKSKFKGIPSGRKGITRVFTEAHKIALSNAMKGRKLSQERKLQISNSMIGKPSRNKGNKISEETRIKMSVASKSLWTPERRKIMSDRMIGNTHSTQK